MKSKIVTISLQKTWGFEFFPTTPKLKTFKLHQLGLLHTPVNKSTHLEGYMSTRQEKHQESSSLNILGKGGMGEVYLDSQSYPQRYVAVKRLLYPVPETQKLLLHEANITGKLAHPNIVPIYEIRNPTDITIEVHMKYIKGRTLFSLNSHKSDDLSIFIGMPKKLQWSKSIEEV